MTKEEKIKILSTFCQKRYKCHDCPLNTETVKMCNSERSIFSTPQKYTEEELDKAGELFAERDNRDFFNSYVDLGTEYDVVERPQHYASTSIECIDAMVETQGVESVYRFCLCNAFKYLWRHRAKNQFEDIKKASWYLNKAVELYEGEKVKSKFELGEEVYVKAIVIRTGLKMGDKTPKVLYDLAVSTEHNTISLNSIGESEIERVVQQ